MASALTRRLLSMVAMLAIISVVVFSLLLLIPGDPAVAILQEGATEEQIRELRAALGLDQPIPVQYWRWLGDAVQGDLGTSLFTSQSVAGAIIRRLPITLSLIVTTLLLALAIGVIGGVAAGSRPGKLTDKVVLLFVSAGMAVPNFWLGLLLILAFSTATGWFPGSGYVPLTESPWQWGLHMALPAATLATSGAAELVRQMRASLVDVRRQDYMLTHKAKGLSGTQIVLKHGVKNAFMPVVTVLGMETGRILSLAIIVEYVFGLPGLGTLAIQSVLNRDVPMIQGILLLSALLVMLANLLVDLSYTKLNPKVAF